MTSKQPSDMSASVRARLMNVAKLNSEAFDQVLVRFAIERLRYPIGGKRRILRRCVSTASKSDAIRPTRPLCK